LVLPEPGLLEDGRKRLTKKKLPDLRVHKRGCWRIFCQSFELPEITGTREIGGDGGTISPERRTLQPAQPLGKHQGGGVKDGGVTMELVPGNGWMKRGLFLKKGLLSWDPKEDNTPEGEGWG